MKCDASLENQYAYISQTCPVFSVFGLGPDKGEEYYLSQLKEKNVIRTRTFNITILRFEEFYWLEIGAFDESKVISWVDNYVSKDDEYDL